jgi:putative colanic acid biosynthesis UDP-glucose lipid carrier transferase
LLLRGLSGQKFSGRSAVLISDEASNSDLVPTLLKHGLQLDYQFTLPADALASDQHETFVSDVVAYLRGSPIDEVVVSVDVARWGDLTRLFSGLRVLPLPVLLVPQGTTSDILRRPFRPMGNAVCIELQREPLDTFERGMKRLIDILGALAGLVLLLPLLLLTAALIKLDSPGPIFFRQKRCGFNGRPFDIFKFRTMTVLENGPVVCQAAKSDSRVTRLGKWLRRTSIDELPQLINVLIGSMSLVGPRPHAAAHDDQFDKTVSNYAFRHHVKPGLTGWAQVNGHRGPTPTLSEIQNRVECDLWYIDNWSLRLDFRIIMRTIIEVMRARNAY